MKILTFAIFEMALIFGVGMVLTYAQAPDAPAVASAESTSEQIDAMSRNAYVLIGAFSYGSASLGFLVGLGVWYGFRGRERFSGRSIWSCLLRLLAPVGVFLVVCLFKPLPDLVMSFGAILGSSALVVTLLIFAVVSVFFHFVSVIPFRPIETASVDS